MLCAVVQNNLVVAVLDLSSAQQNSLAQTYEAVVDISAMSPAPGIGWQFTGSGLLCDLTKITKLALQNRFTSAEFMGILAYADNTGAPYCYAIKMILQKQASATYIDLTRSDTIVGMNVLVAAGLITSDRANTILTTLPTDAELYKGQ